MVLDGSVDREVCPLNLAPTAGTAVAMAIGDALAAVWMQRQGVSEADFAANHPAGALGRQLTLTVAELMVPVASGRLCIPRQHWPMWWSPSPVQTLVLHGFSNQIALSDSWA